MLPHHHRLLATAATALALFLVSSEAAAQDLTLDEAIRLALETNERAEIAKLEIEAAEGDLETARSEFLPTLVLGASVTARPPRGRASEDRTPPVVTGAGTLTLRQPLLNPSALPLYRRAGHALKAAQYGATEARSVLAYDTSRAFVHALAAEWVLRAAEARRDRAKANLDNAQARAEAQLNSSNDATRARLDMASAMRDVAQSQGTVERGRLDLRLLIGRDVRGALAAPDQLSRAAESFAGEAARLKRVALDQRPDVKARREQTLAFREAAAEPHYRLVPSIDLVGQLQVSPDPFPEESWHDESVSIQLSWTLYDGGTRYGVHRTRAAQAASAALEERQLSRSVDTDVRTALVALDSARATLRVAETAIATAHANSEETEVLYQQGLARVIELTDANSRRFEAEVNLASAKLDVIEAYLQVRFAQGLPPVDAAPGAGARQ